MKMILTAIRVSVVLMLICGLIYPLVTTGVAQVLFPKQANGSLIESGGALVGSELLAQNVESPKLFHPRASNAKYDPTSSAGSNTAVASEDYVKGIADQIEALKQENPKLKEVPADLVTVSGSGFDPDLSPDAARAQVPRISRESGIGEQQLHALIDTHTKSRQLGIFGEPRVNVTELNIELLKQSK
ncbi:potassium-transporting ATPase subunit KdpC [Paenibacillus sp. SYP-B3998]|uniref:Potassium-transporting ATPase KdpC subunit n=1 Tax=Paenibacillus sp. SYP-B3998 TaxID=2678564 RepID=A0A6G4A201_9BACL|nr:potassium-transporting ATPase subunit KdpC [Paenibacillus sp. SYP-B3998]NEW08318.1 potassium-transporting ATPase subunit KdpC [Paenibacillus sp. SYP-B3998]